MLFVDLDRFKMVNDSLGHARGDQLLIMVANRLRVVVNAEHDGSVLTRPLLARLAGDEFTIFFPQIEAVAEIERVARRVVLAISEPFELCSHSVDIGASIGIAVSPDHGTSIEALMRAADIAMYRAKSRGGGQHCLFDGELAAEHQQKIETEKALTEAVQRDEFAFAFQPQMSLVTGEIAGAEALLRWNHPRDGLQAARNLHPDRRADRLDLRDRRVGGRRDCNHARQLATRRIRRSAGVQREPAPGRAAGFLRQAAPILCRRRRAAVDMIELEFTESAAMEVSASVLEEIAALRDDGAHDRDRRFRYRLLKPRALARNAARPGQARSFADRRHRDAATRRG